MRNADFKKVKFVSRLPVTRIYDTNIQITERKIEK